LIGFLAFLIQKLWPKNKFGEASIFTFLPNFYFLPKLWGTMLQRT